MDEVEGGLQVGIILSIFFFLSVIAQNRTNDNLQCVQYDLQVQHYCTSCVHNFYQRLTRRPMLNGMYGKTTLLKAQ